MDPRNNGSPATIPFAIDVVIPRIIEIGMQRIPNEACGLVIPNFDIPPDQWVHELTNRSPDPTNSYDLDPRTVASLIEDREVWGDILVWHTHPSGHIGPSRRDWEHRITGVKYLVVALPGGEATLFEG
jgi:proteasome lid subunit RPN8/RPN11